MNYQEHTAAYKCPFYCVTCGDLHSDQIIELRGNSVGPYLLRNTVICSICGKPVNDNQINERK